MRQINVGIPPKALSDKHLIAEHTDLWCIPNDLIKRLQKFKQINFNGPLFSFGKGHVLFFNDKIEYLHIRYMLVYGECLQRKLNVQYKGEVFDSARQWAPHLYNDWRPRLEDVKLVLGRLQNNMPETYTSLSAYRIWKEIMSLEIRLLKHRDPELFKNIKQIK